MFIGRFSALFDFPITKMRLEMPLFATDTDVIKSVTRDFSLYFIGALYGDASVKIANPAEFAAKQYEEYSFAGFENLNGSFFIAMFFNDGSICLVNDRHGTASQVYYNKEYFSSSLGEMLDMPGTEARPDINSLAAFLFVGYVGTPASAIKDINKLPAGCCLRVKDGQTNLYRYFDTNNTTPATFDSLKTLDNYSDEYSTLHHRAILSRVGGSTNVGILLSGGYDSGCNLAALRDVYDGIVSSYSIGFKGDNWTELPLARIMSEHFGTSHNEYEIDGSEIVSLPEIVSCLGDPFVEGGLMVNYSVMRMIGSEKPDVILGGDGSDQYFGTSGREVAMNYLLSKTGGKLFVNAIHSLLSRNCFDKDGMAYRIRFHLDKILNILEGDRFGFPEYKLHSLLRSDIRFYLPLSMCCDTRSFEHLFIQHSLKSDLEKIIDQVILFKASRMADMFGNNLTFPYMDNALYDFLQKLPVKYRQEGNSVLDIARGRTNSKYLLKYHYKPQLPKEITEKKKQGGFAPMPIFFNDDKQRSVSKDFILSSSVCDDFLSKNAVESFLVDYDGEVHSEATWFWYKQNRAIQYFNLLTLAVWWERYIKGNRNVSL